MKSISISHVIASDLLELYLILLNLVLTQLENMHAPLSNVPPRGRLDLSLLATRILLASQPKHVQLPGWLTQRLLSTSIENKDSALVPFLRLLLEFDRLQEAHRLASDLLSSALLGGASQEPSIKKVRLNLLQICFL